MAKSINNKISFINAAQVILGSLERQDAMSSREGGIVKAAVQQFLDSCTIAGISRDEAGCEALKKTISDCPVFLEAMEYGSLTKDTVTTYVGGITRAHYWDLEWYASAYRAPTAGGMEYLPWGKGAKAAKARLSSVTTTTDAELLLTIRKALEQAGLLNRDVIRSILIDAACEVDPDFKV
jgi:hypothetical protein